MPYDETLAVRVRGVLSRNRGVDEKKMFGGIAFMIGGHMCCGVGGEDVMVRVGPEAYEDALSEPHARPMDFTGQPLKGFVYVGRAGVETDRALARWVAKGVAFCRSLPPK